MRTVVSLNPFSLEFFRRELINYLSISLSLSFSRTSLRARGFLPYIRDLYSHSLATSRLWGLYTSPISPVYTGLILEDPGTPLELIKLPGLREIQLSRNIPGNSRVRDRVREQYNHIICIIFPNTKHSIL